MAVSTLSVCFAFILSRWCCWSILTFKFPLAIRICTYFEQNTFRENRFNIRKNVQHSKVNNKQSFLRCLPLLSSMAYVNQFLALPNATYSHSVHLYWMCIRENGNIGKFVCVCKVRGDEETAETLENYTSGNIKSNVENNMLTAYQVVGISSVTWGCITLTYSVCLCGVRKPKSSQSDSKECVERFEREHYKFQPVGGIQDISLPVWRILNRRCSA